MPLNIPQVPVNVIVGIHFVLLAWGYLSPWLGNCYFFTNVLVLLLGLWGMKDKVSAEPVQYFLFGLAFTILNDIILLGMNFESAKNGHHVLGKSSSFQFTAAMAIINLLLKPFSCLLLFKHWQNRGNPGYDDIESGFRPPAQSGYTAAPQTTQGYTPAQGGFNPPPSSGGYMPPSGGYAPQETKGYRPPQPQTTYIAPSVGP